MKKIIVFAIVFCLMLSIAGCKSKKNDGSKEPLDYISKKYSDNFNIISFYAGNALNGSPLKLYVTNDKIPDGEKVLVKGTTKDKVITYSDDYIAVLNMQKASDIVKQVFSEYYSDFSLNENLYITIDYKGIDKNITTENYLADKENGLRLMIYVKSNDNDEMQQEKIKSFLTKLKEMSIYINSFYFAFFDENFELSNIKDEYRYEYSIDCVSRDNNCKGSITKEYFAYWIERSGDYNFVVKFHQKVI